MAEDTEQTVIKKYANRRLYDTGSSTYVTLEDLADMVKRGDDFIVQDAKSGEDLTRSVLTQIIFEQEGKNGQNLLPVAFLRQLISFYGDSMQSVVPSYLEFTMKAFAREQEKLRDTMETMGIPKMGLPGMGSLEDQVRKNTEMFHNAMQMFNPFAVGGNVSSKPETSASENDSGEDLADLKKQLADIQVKLNKIS